MQRRSSILPLRDSGSTVAVSSERVSRSSSSRSRIPCPSIRSCSSTSELKSTPIARPKIQLQRSRSAFNFQVDQLKTPINNLLSVNQNISSIRSSSALKRGGKDPRTLADKKWQIAELIRVENYLMALTGRKFNIKPMTTQKFLEILNSFEFLTGGIIKLTQANYVEEVPKLMRAFDYPSQIKKSFLIALNTSSNWSFVLGVCSWLIEIDSTIRELNLPEDNFISDSARNVYPLWITGEVQGFCEDEIEARLLKKEELVDNKNITNKVDKLKEERSALLLENDKLLETLQEHNVQNDTLSNIEESIQIEMKESGILKQHIDCKIKTVTKLKMEQNDLRKCIEKQNVSKEQYTAALTKYKDIENQYARLSNINSELKQTFNVSETKYHRSRNEINKLVDELNKQCVSSNLYNAALIDFHPLKPDVLTILVEMQHVLATKFDTEKQACQTIIQQMAETRKEQNVYLNYSFAADTEKITKLKKENLQILLDIEKQIEQTVVIEKNFEAYNREMENINDYLKHLDSLQDQVIEGHRLKKKQMEETIDKITKRSNTLYKEKERELKEIVKKMKATISNANKKTLKKSNTSSSDIIK